jgi:transcriptional antiterminator RfaH
MPLLAPEPFLHPADLLDLDPAAESPPLPWWVLHTRPRAEKALARRFFARGVPFFLPLYRKQWQSRGRLLTSHVPLFPSYVFLLGDHQARLLALETNAVVRALPVHDPRQLHHDLAAVYRLLLSGSPLTPEQRLQPGDLVQITAGPLSGLQGKVLRRGNQLRFVIEVQLLQQGVSVELEHWMIRSLREQPQAGLAGTSGR